MGRFHLCLLLVDTFKWDHSEKACLAFLCRGKSQAETITFGPKTSALFFAAWTTDIQQWV
jgi:hypothetical protein